MRGAGGIHSQAPLSDFGQLSNGASVRGAELEAARAALNDGRGVLVVGPPGSGRTRFIRDLMPHVDQGVRSKIWVGENLHEFHEARAADLAGAARSGTILLGTALSRRSLPASLDALRRDGVVDHIDLKPLAARSLLCIAQGILDGPLDAAAAMAVIPSRGGTDVAVLRETITKASADGSLVERDGLWHRVSPIVPGAQMRRLLLAHAAAHSSLTGDILEVIALTPEIALSRLARIIADLDHGGSATSELTRLHDLGVVEFLDHGDDPWVRLRDGVHELLLPYTVGVMRRRRLSSAIVGVLGQVPAAQLGPRELVAFARKSLSVGTPIDSATLNLAARASLRSANDGLSLQLATAAVDAGGGFDAQMTLAAAESQMGRASQAGERLERLADAAEGDVQRGEALAVLTRHVLESAGTSASTVSLGFEPADDDDESTILSTAIKGFMLYALGDTVGAAELVEPALPILRGESRAHGYLVMAAKAMLAGQLAQAGSSFDAAEAVCREEGLDPSRIYLARAFLGCFEGRIAESLTTVTTFRSAVGSLGHGVPRAMCDWAIGGILNFAGRVGESVGELRSALAVMERIGLARTALIVRTELATALGIRGDEAGAGDALAPALASATPDFDLYGKSYEALGWVHAGAGRRAQAVDAFVRAADEYSAPGHHMATIIALTDAARAGAAGDLLPRIELLAVGTEGLLAELLVRNSRALAHLERAQANPADPTAGPAADLAAEFEAIGEAFIAIGVHNVAAEAFSHAARLHLNVGDSRRAANASRRVDEQLIVCGVDRLPFVNDRTANPLSEREAEIARMAAAGRTNREISAALVLSVRTVETHLQRVYQKLGVRGRSELAEAL